MKSEQEIVQDQEDEKYTVTQILPPQDKIINELYNYPDLFPTPEAKEIIKLQKENNDAVVFLTTLQEKMTTLLDKIEDHNHDKKKQLIYCNAVLKDGIKPFYEFSKNTYGFDFVKNNKFPNEIKDFQQFRKTFKDYYTLVTKFTEKIQLQQSELKELYKNTPEIINNNGICFGLTSLWLWNKRQENIGNTTREGNPTRIMQDVLNKITDNPNNIESKDVEMLTNYILATQNSKDIAKKLNLIDIADKVDQKYLSSKRKDEDRIIQGSYLVNPSDDIENPMLQKVFNFSKNVYFLKDLRKILLPGVLVQLHTENHAMGCYMDEEKNIFFYDPNDGKEIKFDDFNKLKKYLTSEKMVTNYFPNGFCYPQVWIANSGTEQQKRIKKYYTDLENDFEKRFDNNIPKKLSLDAQFFIELSCETDLVESQILYATKNNKTIDGKDPIVYAIESDSQIEGMDPVCYAIENNKFIDGKFPLEYAVEMNCEITPPNSIKPQSAIAYAIEKNLEIFDQNPVHYAIKNNITIDGKSATDYSNYVYENSKQAVKHVNKWFAATEEDDKNKREELFKNVEEEITIMDMDSEDLKEAKKAVAVLKQSMPKSDYTQSTDTKRSTPLSPTTKSTKSTRSYSI